VKNAVVRLVNLNSFCGYRKKKRAGDISAIQVQIKALPLARLEVLGEALLDITDAIDLERWLEV
jgi:hypothetical protein